MVSLPFAEDLRNYPFPPLASSDPRTKKSFCPTSDQSAAARELIQALDLDDRLDLKETRNPTLQVFYDAVSYRALHPDASLPSPDPLVTASLVPDPLLFAKAAPELSRFREAFPTERNRAFEKASAEKGFWRDLIDDDTRVITLDSYMKKSESGDEDSPPDPKKLRQIDSSELELYATVDEVGSVTPASDFEQMLKRRDGDFVLVAISQLCERVTRYVEDSLGSQYYEKAADCVRALRRGCVQEDEPTSFNKFLDTLRKSYEFGPRSEFWSILSRDKLGPISSGESLYSEVTSSQSQHYFEPIDLNSPLPQVESPSPAPHDSVIDDLLDMAE